MQLKFCAFTGPDDAVDPNDLVKLSKEYPFAEWSILYSPKDQGKPRSPTEAWIRKFSEICKDTHTCMHLCDTALAGLVSGDKAVLDLMKGFKRIQLNLEYMDAGRQIEPAALAARVKELPQWEFIVQYGKKYKHFLDAFKGVANHAVLFDGSMGEGIVPGEWPKPMDGHSCGYAGGLNPDNMQKNLEAIARATPPNYVTWVDQETGARTDNKFDLAKVRRGCELAAPYAQKKGLAPATSLAAPQ